MEPSELSRDPVFQAANTVPSLVLFLSNEQTRPSPEQLERSHALLSKFLEDPLGLFALATLYLEGAGCEANLGRALELFHLSATLGCAKSQNSLGGLYHTGRADASQPMEKDHELALSYFRLAAKQGHCLAQFNLALYYERGFAGLSVDKAEALKWYKLAAENGNEGALAAVARLTSPLTQPTTTATTATPQSTSSHSYSTFLPSAPQASQFGFLSTVSASSAASDFPAGFSFPPVPLTSSFPSSTFAADSGFNSLSSPSLFAAPIFTQPPTNFNNFNSFNNFNNFNNFARAVVSRSHPTDDLSRIANLNFSVSRMHCILKSLGFVLEDLDEKKKTLKNSGEAKDDNVRDCWPVKDQVGVTAVMEYLSAELLELSGQHTEKVKACEGDSAFVELITMQSLLAAVQADEEELGVVFENCSELIQQRCATRERVTMALKRRMRTKWPWRKPKRRTTWRFLPRGRRK